MKIEAEQKDGITPKERIIRFFEKGIAREYAEKFYNEAEKIGERAGTDAFDDAISIICLDLCLNVRELEKEFKDNEV